MNPREACTPDGFRDRSIRPLWHPSVLEGYRRKLLVFKLFVLCLGWQQIKYCLFKTAKGILALELSLTGESFSIRPIDSPLIADQIELIFELPDKEYEAGPLLIAMRPRRFSESLFLCIPPILVCRKQSPLQILQLCRLTATSNYCGAVCIGKQSRVFQQWFAHQATVEKLTPDLRPFSIVD